MLELFVELLLYLRQLLGLENVEIYCFGQLPGLHELEHMLAILVSLSPDIFVAIERWAAGRVWLFRCFCSVPSYLPLNAMALLPTLLLVFRAREDARNR